MYIYFLLLLYFFALFVLVYEFKEHKRNFFLSLTFGVGLFLLMALRKYTVGVDLERYVSFYSNLDDFNMDLDIPYEPGYILLLYFLKAIGAGEQVYIALVSALAITSFSFFIYLYSKNSFFIIEDLTFFLGIWTTV